MCFRGFHDGNRATRLDTLSGRLRRARGSRLRASRRLGDCADPRLFGLVGRDQRTGRTRRSGQARRGSCPAALSRAGHPVCRRPPPGDLSRRGHASRTLHAGPCGSRGRDPHAVLSLRPRVRAVRIAARHAPHLRRDPDGPLDPDCDLAGRRRHARVTTMASLRRLFPGDRRSGCGAGGRDHRAGGNRSGWPVRAAADLVVSSMVHRDWTDHCPGAHDRTGKAG